MQKQKRKFIIILVFSIFIVFSLAAVVEAQGLKDAFGNTGNAGTVAGAGGYKIDGTVTAESMVAKVINIILSTLGVVFLILMLYGGYIWMTASGDEARVTKAKNLITAAIIGVIIVVSAYAISYFVIEKVTTGVLDNAPATKAPDP
ncbi:hypothetical protein KAU09_01510 [Candidatus Parcubacteria bacterium]|nr:hypothetical protein [Candidatus Parcubacteria bacterium]